MYLDLEDWNNISLLIKWTTSAVSVLIREWPKEYEYEKKMVKNNPNAINHPGRQGSSSFHGPLEK